MSTRCCDPLSENHRPHWLVVSDIHRNLLSSTSLPGGSDLRATLREVLLTYASNGWQAEGNGAYGFVFLARGSERRMVNLTPMDPACLGGRGHGSLLVSSS